MKHRGILLQDDKLTDTNPPPELFVWNSATGVNRCTLSKKKATCALHMHIIYKRRHERRYEKRDER